MSLKNPVTPPGIDPGTVRLVAQRLNHYATPGPYTAGSANVKVQKYVRCEVILHVAQVVTTDWLQYYIGYPSNTIVAAM